MQGLDFSVVPPYWAMLGDGLWWTVVISSLSAIASIIAGVGFALIVLYGTPVIQYPVRGFMSGETLMASLTFAPAFNSARTTGMEPSRTAKRNAVNPESTRVFISAPARSSVSTTAALPSAAANIKAVWP